METTTETCDTCSATYTVEDRWVVRIPRPSDPADMCGILWVCPTCGPGMGDSCRTEAAWEAYIESPEAARAGHLWLT